MCEIISNLPIGALVAQQVVHVGKKHPLHTSFLSKKAGLGKCHLEVQTQRAELSFQVSSLLSFHTTQLLSRNNTDSHCAISKPTDSGNQNK